MNKISVQNYSCLTPSHVKSCLILKNAKFLASYFIQVYKKYLDFRIEASEWHSAINQILTGNVTSLLDDVVSNQNKNSYVYIYNA